MNQTGPPARRDIGLPPGQFAAAFPFHLALDHSLEILQAGSTLRRICPDVQAGADLAQLFRPIRPEGQISVEWIQEHRQRFFLLEHRGTRLQLRGEFVYLADERVLLFLGSPWFLDSSEIAARGLAFDDFAIHDPMVDLLQVFQASKQALADAKKLAAKLTAQRAQLRTVNEKLREQEAEYRKLALIAARTDNAVVLTDAEGFVVWVNEGFTRLTGYRLEEMLGKRPGDVLQGSQTDPETVRYMRDRIRRGEGFRVEILNHGKSGRRYWLAIEVQPIHDEAGRLTNFMAIESDITERRAAQQRLAVQYEVSRTLVEADSLATAIPRVLRAVCENLDWAVGACWQLTGDRLRCLEIWHGPGVQAPRFVGMSRQIEFTRGAGLPGRVWASGQPGWIADVTRDRNFPRHEAARAEGLHGAFAFPVLLHDRVWGVVEFFSRSVEEPDETLLQTLTSLGNQIGQYIEGQAAESALRDVNRLQQAILEGATYSIISTAPDGTIRTFNRAAERMLGYASAEVVGQATPALIHDPAEVSVRAAELSAELGRRIEPGFETFVAKAALGTVDEREWTYVRKDGSRFPVRLSVTRLLDDQGQVTGYLGVASDITESKRVADELLRAKEAAEAANRAKSEFLATMSHEIRTPMNAVIGMNALLLNTALTDRQREFAQAVALSAEGLLHVINDVLDFSKIEAGKLAVVAEEFALRPVVDGVMEVTALREPKKPLQLAAIVHHQIPPRLTGDPQRLRQILVNLVGNAVKFTEQGEVLLRVFPQALQANRVRLRFEVTDTGVGLTEEQLRRIFRPFVQADPSAHRRYGGTGLGLAICEKLVRLLGGKIGARSVPQGGSTFWFELDFGAPDQPAAEGDHPALRRLRSVVGSPHPGTRESLQEQFSSWGVPCAQATSAAELIAVVSAEVQSGHKPVVLCDEALLAAGGTALRERLRSWRGECRHLLLVDASADWSEDAAARGLFDGWLVKPVRQSPLFNQLMTTTEHRPAPAARATRVIARGVSAAATRSFSDLAILLAEDHPINRRLGLLMLEELGAQADVAVNGVEVLAALQAKPYDLILMDCNMPEMDGYEAAAAVRRWQASPAGQGRPPPRIVALTANALTGERERCLAAGMDDYLTKPFTSAQLQDVLAKTASALPGPARASSSVAAVLNPARLDQLLGELDPADVRPLVEDFVRELPGQIAEMTRRAEAEQWKDVERLAHALKGSGASLGFESCSENARLLETAAQQRDAGTAVRSLAALRSLCDPIAEAFAQWGAARNLTEHPEL